MHAIGDIVITFVRHRHRYLKVRSPIIGEVDCMWGGVF